MIVVLVLVIAGFEPRPVASFYDRDRDVCELLAGDLNELWRSRSHPKAPVVSAHCATINEHPTGEKK